MRPLQMHLLNKALDRVVNIYVGSDQIGSDLWEYTGEHWKKSERLRNSDNYISCQNAHWLAKWFRCGFLFMSSDRRCDRNTHTLIAIISRSLFVFCMPLETARSCRLPRTRMLLLPKQACKKGSCYAWPRSQLIELKGTITVISALSITFAFSLLSDDTILESFF